MNHCATETNRFAEQFIRGNTLKRRSRVHEWFPTDSKEVKTFLGITFLMGIIQKPNIQMCSFNDPLYSSPIFKQIMKRDRYLLILKFWYYSNNENIPSQDDPSVDKLFKIRPVNHLHEKFQKVYVPTREVCTDESLTVERKTRFQMIQSPKTIIIWHQIVYAV